MNTHSPGRSGETIFPNAHVAPPTLNAEYVVHGVGPREVDPFELSSRLWPKDKWPVYQKKIVYSFWDNVETVVKAGNKVGKDYIGGFIAVVAFLTRHPCRGVTTSAKKEHLAVLWGEIGQRIVTSKIPLLIKDKGPLHVTHQNIRKFVNGEQCPLSYVVGMVAGDDTIAAMQGHHIARTNDGIWRTFFMCDEASSVNHEYYRMARTWFNRAYIFGNPWPCNNFFYQAFKGQPKTDDRGGDILNDIPGTGYYRKVFTIKATDSPNVRLGLAQEAAGKIPTDEIIVPGVKPFSEYKRDLKHWDTIQRTVSLEGEFYEGQEARMFPQNWLHNSALLARRIGLNHPKTGKPRVTAKGVGVDCAMGVDNTAMVAVDECGVLEIISKKTPDTNTIVGDVEAFVRKWNCPWENVYFDIAGGGKQHADRLRARGRNIRTIHFGSSPSDDTDHTHYDHLDRNKLQDTLERKIAYRNKRAEMYGNLREILDPSLLSLSPFHRAEALKAIMGHDGPANLEFYGFAIPDGHSESPFRDTNALAELHRQMGPIPLKYTDEGIIWLIPKHKRDADDDRPTLTGLLGCSPDELDALVLAVHAMLRPPQKSMYTVSS